VVREYAESLPEKLRVPLVLHFGLGLSHAEVAAALGDPKPTVTSRIQAGVEQLRASLTRESAFASLATAALVEAALRDGWRSVREAPVARAPAASALEKLAAARPLAAGSKVAAALYVALAAGFAGSLREGGPGVAPAAGAVSSQGAPVASAPAALPAGQGAPVVSS